jgi:SSS family solute:Na+ symporter
MDPYQLFLLLLAAYIALLAAIGLLSSRRQRSVTDFWLAGRELGPINIGISAAASWITASALLLATGLFLLIGVGSIWLWVFPNIAALIVVAFLAKRIKSIPALTQPELMEIRYDPMVRVPVALAITIMMILFSVVDFIGFKLVLGTFFGVPPAYAILIMAASVAFYVSIGGFRAVVWTDVVQYALLAGLALFVATIAFQLPAKSGSSFIAVASSMGSEWWNPLSLGGVMGVLVIQLALLPGWIAEQDPWQKIWAAKDEQSAKRGLLIGALLLAFVYLCCLVTAIGLSARYPMPEGEVGAEMLYLQLIKDSVSPAMIAILTIGFAAASMSCTDTFATSGASCISRDLVQRHLRQAATMREMMLINRALVVVMIAISAVIALNVDSIMDSVIIATVIGTTSYFFPIIGGLYWKRASKWGAMAALVAGGGTQILLILYEQLVLKAKLDTISPFLTEHGVLVGLTLSAVTFIGISLATPMPQPMRLAPFFADEAAKLFGSEMLVVDKKDAKYRQVVSNIDERITGDRAHLNLRVDIVGTPARTGKAGKQINWEAVVRKIKSMHKEWYAPTGSHIIYRLTQSDMMACVKMVYGDKNQIWLSAEPRHSQIQRQKDELFLAFMEIELVVAEDGQRAVPSTFLKS